MTTVIVDSVRDAREALASPDLSDVLELKCFRCKEPMVMVLDRFASYLDETDDPPTVLVCERCNRMMASKGAA